MRKFRLTIAYDGTGFVGWQRQASGPSVQALVEDVLAVLDGRPVVVEGAGRTDAGVHALGQVASFALEREIDPQTLVRALNFHLPESVRALDAAEVDDGFHARFSARGKHYRYHIWNGHAVPPMLKPYAWHVPLPLLDVAMMSEAARMLEGAHDFAAFQSVGTNVPTTERVIASSEVRTIAGSEAGIVAGLDATAGGLVAYEVQGDGFLRHMVRSIVGTLVEIGQGRRPAAWMRAVLQSRNRTQAGRTAPAEGLFLVAVTYEPAVRMVADRMVQ
jgi:tRNA pseudouridine38-40 synthase